LDKETRREENGDHRKITSYLSNERTYLAWLRTGIATMGLGFVIAKFGLTSGSSTLYLSNIIGIFIIAVGATMELLALSRFRKNQERIRSGSYQPSTGTELILSSSIFLIALLLIGYMFLSL
jgi:putative membrane protein